jgi:hypothetical protein
LVAAFADADADVEAEAEADGETATAGDEAPGAAEETTGVALGSTKLGVSALCAAGLPQAASARLLAPMTTRFRTL